MTLNTIQLPQPSEISQKERERSMAAYLMMFVSSTAGVPLPFINLIASILYYYYTRETSKFVHFHDLQSLLSQIPVTLVTSATIIWSVYYFFTNIDVFNLSSMPSGLKALWITTILLNLLYVIFSIIGAMRAYNGRMYYFPFFGRYAFERVFQKEQAIAKKLDQNTPPGQ